MVEFKTKIDKDAIQAVQKEDMKKMKKLYTGFAVFFLALGVMMLAITISDYIEGLPTDELIFDVFYTVFCLVFGVMMYPLFKWVVKKRQNDSMMGGLIFDIEEVYKFDDEKIYIFSNKGEDYRSAVEATYKYINNIVETDTHYILYISKIQCHVLNKKDITKGTLEELNEMFSKNLPVDKFKRQLKG